MNLKSYLSLGVASVAVLTGAGAAEAAALAGRVGINPPSPVGGEETGVILIGTGETVPGSNVPATDFDWVPPVGGGTGDIVEINANPLDTGENDFEPFIGFNGDIQDITNSQILPIAAGATTLPNFIVIPDAFSITLTGVAIPEYSFDGSGTTVSVGVNGDFINLSDGSNDVSQGVGTFSVDFAGLSIAETQALFDEPGEIPEGFSPGTYSSNWVVEAEVPPVVPEASNLLGLLVVGLGGATMLARKK